MRMLMKRWLNRYKTATATKSGPVSVKLCALIATGGAS